MKVGADVTCMYTNFGGCSSFGFGDTATFKNGQFSLSDHKHVHPHLQYMYIKEGQKWRGVILMMSTKEKVHVHIYSIHPETGIALPHILGILWQLNHIMLQLVVLRYINVWNIHLTFTSTCSTYTCVIHKVTSMSGQEVQKLHQYLERG